MVTLANPSEFYRALIANVNKNRGRLDCVDLALETTEAVFRFELLENSVAYRTDFSYFFGLPISTHRRLQASGGEGILVSPFGDRIRMTSQVISISNRGAELIIADGGDEIREYFSDLLLILAEVQAFLGGRGPVSKGIPEFRADIRSLFRSQACPSLKHLSSRKDE